MNTTTSTRRVAALACAAALALAACGSDDTSSDDATAPAATAPAATGGTADMDMDIDMESMNMGDPDATAADDVAGAALARGEFALLDTRPQGYDDASGTAVIARSTAGTTVTIALTGLLPDVDFISHVHAEACAPNNGGPHYQFDVGGATTPPNEIHLAFTSDGDGNGFMTVENHAVAGVEAQAIVVHPAEFLDNKIACADLVDDVPGAIAAAVAAGTSGDHGDTAPMTTDDS